jgi:hypothetical protein
LIKLPQLYRTLAREYRWLLYGDDFTETYFGHLARNGRSHATAVMSSIHIRKTQMRRYLS